MSTLEDIEAIKQLKYRYFRFLDTNAWQEFGACLSENCTADYSAGKFSFEGREAIVGFMAKYMSADTLISMHTGHHPEIQVAKDGQGATGHWYLQDMILDLERKTRLTGTAIYTDRYSKCNDEWLISHTGYTRIYESVEPLTESHRMLRNRFMPKAPKA